MKNPIIVLVLLLVVGFGGFYVLTQVGSDPKTPVAGVDNKGQEGTTEVTYNGEELYAKSCIGCHGDQYQGSAGPPLKGLNSTKEEIVDVLKNGKGIMPPGLASGEVEQMADWLLTLE